MNGLEEYCGRKVDFEKLKSCKLENSTYNGSDDYFKYITYDETKEIVAFHIGSIEILKRFTVDSEEVGDSITIAKVEFSVFIAINEKDEIQNIRITFGEKETNSAYMDTDFILNFENKVKEPNNVTLVDHKEVEKLPEELESDFCKRLSMVLV